jgi:hypothetical protein
MRSALIAAKPLDHVVEAETGIPFSQGRSGRQTDRPAARSAASRRCDRVCVLKQKALNVFPCLKAGDFCHRREREFPLTEANVLARRLKQRCLNHLIPCGDITLANRGNHVSTSSIRRSKALGPSGASRVGRSRTFRWWSSLPRFLPEIELHLSGAVEIARLLPAVNSGVSDARFCDEIFRG